MRVDMDRVRFFELGTRESELMQMKDVMSRAIRLLGEGKADVARRTLQEALR